MALTRCSTIQRSKVHLSGATTTTACSANIAFARVTLVTRTVNMLDS